MGDHSIESSRELTLSECSLDSSSQTAACPSTATSIQVSHWSSMNLSSCEMNARRFHEKYSHFYTESVVYCSKWCGLLLRRACFLIHPRLFISARGNVTESLHGIASLVALRCEHLDWNRFRKHKRGYSFRNVPCRVHDAPSMGFEKHGASTC